MPIFKLYTMYQLGAIEQIPPESKGPMTRARGNNAGHRREISKPVIGPQRDEKINVRLYALIYNDIK